MRAVASWFQTRCMYSLVSAPVLGFDLARLQGGSAVADVLLRGLALTPEDLVILAEAKSCDDWERLQLWQDVEVAAQQRRATRQVPDTAEMAALAELGELAAALTVLERAPLGSVDGLLHC